jgi:hypothetical protein
MAMPATLAVNGRHLQLPLQTTFYDIFPQKKILDATRQLLEHLSPEYAGNDYDYAVSLSCMEPDNLEHYVRTHVDGEDIAGQIGITLGKCVGGHLTMWRENGTSHTVNYNKRFVFMDGRLLC